MDSNMRLVVMDAPQCVKAVYFAFGEALVSTTALACFFSFFFLTKDLLGHLIPKQC